MRWTEPQFPLSHGICRVDDWQIVSGIIVVIRNGLRWRDALSGYGPHTTIYNRIIRWSRLGVFNRNFAELAAKGGKPDQLIIDAALYCQRHKGESMFGNLKDLRRIHIRNSRCIHTFMSAICIKATVIFWLP